MKTSILKQIKNISYEDAINDFIRLQNIDLYKTSPLSLIGLNFIDYFFFEERLNTIGKKGISFYTFLENFNDYIKKPYVKKIFDFEYNRSQNIYKSIKRTFQLCYGSINAFRPIVAMDIYEKYKPKSILNLCSGWGGFIVGACALNISEITAIDNNKNLLKPYKNMIKTLKQLSSTKITFINKNVLDVNLTKKYDMIISSPPYYNTEIYGNVKPYKTKKEWEELFYKPMFQKFWKNLDLNGNMVINVPKEIYEKCLVPLFGESKDKILLPKYKRNNKYEEFIYVYEKLI